MPRCAARGGDTFGQAYHWSLMQVEYATDLAFRSTATRGPRDRPESGGAVEPPGCCNREFGMKWRGLLELVGADGIVGVHEVGGRAAAAEYAPQMIGLTLEEGKHVLAALQGYLVQAQAEDHCRHRRRWQRCGSQ
jgi:hypothetical protein